ncbi:MAG TPA: class I SAM-dependent methyltransferase [Humidesulfovibrio sp.]|uniref:class I SAM-dependent methyltransferase n=1 Tax=Humidesulfovibrio sp. TaxID=2910988 RepID=UPI002CE65494|nr:class I SAM-dependent methyltransferase [Humidesulfovibrio sp.]HWR02809.1 class I SAM-dependent methyltransferase [Humidesulfovibrio sp.]
MGAKLQEHMNRLGPWYHKIALPGGAVTPGHDWEPLWENIRRAASGMDYTGRRVLDIGSMDGMWAFEAEARGAAEVLTADICGASAERLLFCRQQLKSRVLPFFNIQVERLTENKAILGEFDIIQHLGVLYHLPDPYVSLSQCRALMRHGGLLAMETAYVAGMPMSCMVFNGVRPADADDDDGSHWWRIYKGAHPQWAPSLSCLLEMLLLAGFIPDTASISTIAQPDTGGVNADAPGTRYKRGRVALAARAAERQEITKDVVNAVLAAAKR